MAENMHEEKGGGAKVNEELVLLGGIGYSGLRALVDHMSLGPEFALPFLNLFKLLVLVFAAFEFREKAGGGGK